MSIKLVSIIINNYNYGSFLEQAILSALGQTYPNTEVIVVDDGSTDNSRAVIEQYRSRIIPVLKDNGGQASAFNAGFEKSRGEIVIFLDSDDRLLPTTVAQIMPSMQNPDTAKVHWPLWVIDERNERTGAVHPNYSSLPAGDFREEVLEKGPASLHSSPTSGNAWSRDFLLDIWPVPEDIYRICADTYLIEIAPFWGAIAAIAEPQGEYRIHGNNAYAVATVEEQLPKSLAYWNNYAGWLIDYCHRQGHQVELEEWKKKSWHHLQAKVIAEVAALPKRPGSLILVEDSLWALGSIGGWERLPFLEYNGLFGGSPTDDDHAIRELERLRSSGAQYIVFWVHSFWWLEAYSGFYEYLCNHYNKVIDQDKILGFDLAEKILQRKIDE